MLTSYESTFSRVRHGSRESVGFGLSVRPVRTGSPSGRTKKRADGKLCRIAILLPPCYHQVFL